MLTTIYCQKLQCEKYSAHTIHITKQIDCKNSLIQKNWCWKAAWITYKSIDRRGSIIRQDPVGGLLRIQGLFNIDFWHFSLWISHLRQNFSKTCHPVPPLIMAVSLIHNWKYKQKSSTEKQSATLKCQNSEHRPRIWCYHSTS